MGKVVNERRARTSDCTCYELPEGKKGTRELMCYSKGVVGTLTNEQEKLFCSEETLNNPINASGDLTGNQDVFFKVVQDSESEYVNVPEKDKGIDKWGLILKKNFAKADFSSGKPSKPKGKTTKPPITKDVKLVEKKETKKPIMEDVVETEEEYETMDYSKLNTYTRDDLSYWARTIKEMTGIPIQKEGRQYTNQEFKDYITVYMESQKEETPQQANKKGRGNKSSKLDLSKDVQYVINDTDRKKWEKFISQIDPLVLDDAKSDISGILKDISFDRDLTLSLLQRVIYWGDDQIKITDKKKIMDEISGVLKKNHGLEIQLSEPKHDVKQKKESKPSASVGFYDNKDTAYADSMSQFYKSKNDVKKLKRLKKAIQNDNDLSTQDIVTIGNLINAQLSALTNEDIQFTDEKDNDAYVLNSLRKDQLAKLYRDRGYDPKSLGKPALIKALVNLDYNQSGDVKSAEVVEKDEDVVMVTLTDFMNVINVMADDAVQIKFDEFIKGKKLTEEEKEDAYLQFSLERHQLLEEQIDEMSKDYTIVRGVGYVKPLDVDEIRKNIKTNSLSQTKTNQMLDYIEEAKNIERIEEIERSLHKNFTDSDNKDLIIRAIYQAKAYFEKKQPKSKKNKKEKPTLEMQTILPEPEPVIEAPKKSKKKPITVPKTETKEEEAPPTREQLKQQIPDVESSWGAVKKLLDNPDVYEDEELLQDLSDKIYDMEIGKTLSQVEKGTLENQVNIKMTQLLKGGKPKKMAKKEAKPEKPKIEDVQVVTEPEVVAETIKVKPPKGAKKAPKKKETVIVDKFTEAVPEKPKKSKSAIDEEVDTIGAQWDDTALKYRVEILRQINPSRNPDAVVDSANKSWSELKRLEQRDIVSQVQKQVAKVKSKNTPKKEDIEIEIAEDGKVTKVEVAPKVPFMGDDDYERYSELRGDYVKWGTTDLDNLSKFEKKVSEDNVLSESSRLYMLNSVEFMRKKLIEKEEEGG